METRLAVEGAGEIIFLHPLVGGWRLVAMYVGEWE
jgi:hypothetical protein